MTTEWIQVANQLPPHTMPVNQADLAYLFVHILRVPAIFSEASRMLSYELFDPLERHFALLWNTLKEMHAAGHIVNYDSLFYVLNSKIINDIHREISPVQAAALLRPDSDGLLFATNHIAEHRLDPGLARQILQRFLHERQVVQPLRAVMSQGNGKTHVAGFRGIIETAMASLKSIDTIMEAPMGLGMPERGAGLPAPVSYEPTTLTYVDPWIRGQRKGDANGLLGVFGAGKTTMGIQMAVTNARNFASQYRGAPGQKRRLSVLLSYEEPEWKMNARLWACAAEIRRAKLETMIETRNWGLLSPPGSPESYERALPGNRGENGTPILSESERWDMCRHWLNQHFVLLDMSGSDRHPNAGRGFVSEIRATLDRLADERNAEIGVAVIDYAGLVCKRFMNANNIDEDKLRHRLGGLGDQLRRDVAEPLQSTVWLLHQFNGTQAKQSPTRLLSFSDASECKSFAENLAVCGCLGVRDRISGVSLINWDKVRYHRNEDVNMPRVRVNGDFSRLDDVSDRFVLSETGSGFMDPATRNALGGEIEPTRRVRSVSTIDPTGIM